MGWVDGRGARGLTVGAGAPASRGYAGFELTEVGRAAGRGARALVAEALVKREGSELAQLAQRN